MTYINSYITINLQGVGGLFHLGLSKIIILRAFTLVVLENLTFEHSHVYNRKKKCVEYLQFCLKMTHINSYITVNLQVCYSNRIILH